MSSRVFAWLTLVTGLALSAVAGIFSVVGLSMIFAGAFWPVVVLGGLLEAAKVIAVSWMYRYRSLMASLGVQTYFSAAIVILMLLTSLGVFGFLTRAHLGTEATMTQAESTIANLQQHEDLLTTQRRQLAEELSTLTSQGNQLVGQLSQASRLSGASGAVKVQQTLTARRTEILKDIKTLDAEIAGLQQQRLSTQTTAQTATADVGPLRYVTQALYGADNINILRKAVTWLTVAIVLVLDPLAVMLLIAANILFIQPVPLPVSAESVTPPLPELPKKRSHKKKTAPTPSIVIEESAPQANTVSLDTLLPHSSLITDLPESLKSVQDIHAKNKYLTKESLRIVSAE